MIINKIKVENFATYRRAELDLDRLGSTISVFGSTGAGKTTFFVDAITLAFYGRAYGQSEKKYAKYVIPTWASRSKVEVDFTLNDGSRYRVIRVLEKSGDARAMLYKLDDLGRVKELIASGIRAVESELAKLIGMDFKTFINTVVVRQGRVAELISRDVSPSERRNIFLRAFDIDFKKHKDKAKELHDMLKGQLEQFKKERELLLRDIHLENEIKRKVVELESKFMSLEKKVATLKGEREKLSNAKSILQERISAIKSEIEQLEDKKQKLANIEDKLKQINAELRGCIELARMEKEIENEYRKLKHRISMLENLSNIEREILLLRESIKNRAQLLARKNEIEEELKVTLDRINDLNSEIKTIENNIRKMSYLNDELERIKTEISNLRGYSKYIEESIRALEEFEGEEVVCPVCKTVLTRERAGEAVFHLREELNEINGNIALLENEHRKLVVEVNKLKNLEETLRLREKELAKLIEKKNQLNRQLTELKSLIVELRESEIRISELESKFNEISQQYKLLFGEYVGVGDAESKLNTCRGMLEECSNKLMKVKTSIVNIESLRRLKVELEAEANQLINEVKVLPKLHSDFSMLQSSLKEVADKLAEVEKLLEASMSEMYKCKARLEQMKQQLQELEHKKSRVKELDAKIAELEKRISALSYLYKYIFHEKGLPLTMLRAFLERVEYWADGYVSRFLPGKSIKIEAGEDEVSIIVYDGAQIRDLTTYSGGETVLLGFAIRLGIARALAEKAGVSPRFLIIDEGFGPLSSEFREELLKTLNELQRDYEKIIVISHVDEVRDNPYFEAQVHVYKDDSGISHIEVLR